MKHKLIRITTVPISFKKLLNGQLKFMSNYFDIVAISSYGKELTEVAKRESIRVIPLNMTRKITPIKDLISLIKMIIILIKEKPIIVHTHTPKAGLIGMLASWICRVPIRLHTVAGLPLMEAKGLRKRLLIITERITYACANMVYPNSFGLLKFIKENSLCNEKKLKVIGYGSSNGIDTEYFKLAPDILEKSNELKKKYNLNVNFIFTFIGRLVRDKGIEELVKAFEKITKEFSNVKLLLVGFFEEDIDPLSKDCLQIIKNNENIIFCGYQEDVRPFFAITDCFVFPSYREGFPNVVLQACAMEVPSIVSDINGCNEIITDGFNGIVVKPKDPEELYNAMKKVLIDNDLLQKLRNNTRNSILGKYDKKTFYNLLLEEYYFLLKKANYTL